MIVCGDVDSKELETPDPLHYSPVNVLGACSVRLFDHLLCLAYIEGEVVVLAPHCQFSDFLPIGFLIVVGDQAYHFCVVSKLNEGLRVVFGHAVMDEKGVQEGTKYTPLRVPSVEYQRGRLVVAYTYHLGVARQGVQNPVAEEGV